MFRHCVMMKFTDDATTEQREAARAGVETLPGLIPEIASYSVGFDAGLAEGNFHMAVVGDFASAEDYQVYATHPDHVRVITDLLRPVLAERAAVQYEF